MDPAGIGALIGISIMVFGMGCFFLCDRRVSLYNRFCLPYRRSQQEEVKEHTHLLIRSPHVKMKTVLPPVKPKTFLLKNLNPAFQANRQLLSTIPEFPKE